MSGIRLLTHINIEKKGVLYYLLMLNPNNVIFFPSSLDDVGLALRAKLIKGIKYGFVGGGFLMISYVTSLFTGIGWH